MSAPTYGFMNHYCAIAEARGKMPCGDQCDECRDTEAKFSHGWNDDEWDPGTDHKTEGP